MRSVIGKVSLVAALMVASIFVFSGTTANADSGSPFNPGDGRQNPMTGDRVAVYCTDTSINVLGIDSDSIGQYLTTFTLDELTSGKAVSHKTSEGTVTLSLDALPQTHIGYTSFEATATSLITDVGTQYHITWTGGVWGADGSAPFVKYFSCTYLPIAGH